MTTDTSAVAAEYAEARERDWTDFLGRRGSLPDYWGLWEGRSFNWKVPVEYIQPLGLEAPATFEALQPVFDRLASMEEVELAPIPWLHLTWCRIGFLRAADIMWSQVESFYANSAPRLRRIPPTTLHLGGLSVADGERVYLGVDDGGMYREARRQARLGVPKVNDVMKDDPLITPEGDRFVPQVDIAYFTGRGSRERVAEALEPFRNLVVGDIALTHLKMARMPIQPHSHYEDLDVVAEMQMLGDDHRKGYHN